MLQKDDLFIKIFLEMFVWFYHFAIFSLGPIGGYRHYK